MEAALQLAGLDYQQVHFGCYLTLVNRISARARAFWNETQDPSSRARILSVIVAKEFGFTGDRDGYEDVNSYDMITLMERRRGVPVSLAILYVAVARKAGWHAKPVEAPGHVYVSLGVGTATALVDPFKGGALVEASTSGGSSEDQGSSSFAALPLKLMSNRDTLVRLVLNAAIRSETAGDIARAAQLFERASVVAPENVDAWLGLARLKILLGEVDSARFDLAAVLEVSRNDDVRTSASRVLNGTRH